MAKIILGFSRSVSPYKIGSSLIQVTEKRNFSHVYIRYQDSLTNIDVVAQASHGYVNEMNYDIFKESNIVVEEYEIKCPDKKYLEVITFIKNNLGNPYSQLQLILIGIKKLFHVELPIRQKSKEYICSEFAALVCRIIGIDMPGDLNYVTPSDLNGYIKNAVPAASYKRLI